MAQTNATTTNSSTTDTNGNGNGSSGRREAKVPTAIDAISKISKILDQLSPSDRKRVLTFVNENNASNE